MSLLLMLFLVYTFHLSPRETLASLKAAIASAQTRICIEEYIFKRGNTGAALMQLLEEKASQGVRVDMLVDAFGSRGFTLYRSPHINLTLRLYRPIWKGGLTFFPRTHRKLMVIDGERAFIGGNCIQHKMLDWRDTMVEITGDIAMLAQHSFDHSFNNIHQKYVPPERRDSRNGHFSLFDSLYYLDNRLFYVERLKRIAAAKKHVLLAAPYFVPDRGLHELLAGKAREGVPTTLLLSQKTSRVVRLQQNNTIPGLVRSGVAIYFYQPVMMHTKSSVIDDWASIGSSNLDILSLHKNRELDLASTEPQFVAAMKAQFENDLQHAHQLDEEGVRYPWWQYCVQQSLYPIRHIM